MPKDDLERPGNRVLGGLQDLFRRIWLAAQEQEVHSPLTQAELKRLQEGKASRETIAEERFWNKRPHSIEPKEVLTAQMQKRRLRHGGSREPFTCCLPMRTNNKYLFGHVRTVSTGFFCGK